MSKVFRRALRNLEPIVSVHPRSLRAYVAPGGSKIANPPLGGMTLDEAAALQARAHRDGRELDLGDALIAGTAMANQMSIVTRNVRHFEGLGVEVINPWGAR